jgi:hypothetical protein
MTTLTIDRSQRDVLEDYTRYYRTGQFEDFDGVIRLGDRCEINRLRREFDEILSLLDQLDWADERPDETAYEITVDLDTFVPWLRDQCDDLPICVAHEEDMLVHVEAGDPDYMVFPDSQEESARVTREEIARYRRELAALESLLGQVETVAVA